MPIYNEQTPLERLNNTTTHTDIAFTALLQNKVEDVMMANPTWSEKEARKYVMENFSKQLEQSATISLEGIRGRVLNHDEEKPNVEGVPKVSKRVVRRLLSKG